VTPEQAASVLRAARQSRRTVSPFTDDHPDLDEEWGYDAQAVDRTVRLAAGEQLVGAKLGLTSAAKQHRMGVDRPIVGFLTQSMLVRPDEVGDRLSSWAQPRIEPEIAFVTSQPIGRPLAADEVEAHIATVGIAAEIIDSRWTDYRFDLPDVLADNTSAAGVILGAGPIELTEITDLSSLACVVEVDGEIVHRATGAAILGDPLRAVRLLSEHFDRRGETLPAASLVLAGALTDAVPLGVGRRYRLAIDALGEVSIDLG
jgi:2-oxo-3-hexenedioate decarboxylase